MPQTQRPTAITTSQDSSTKDDDDLNERGSEDFIRKNFIRFFGNNQEVDQWLAATIVQFEDFKILQSNSNQDVPGRTPTEYSLNILKELFSREELQTRKLPRNRLLKNLINEQLTDQQLDSEKID
ncbi:unnamed protein product [Didymodactylos carnosus]|uniref:Uncharacterized protein n=1 Tax=Didymodactylos carnosus TaxID=1234261 RepID=A0A814SX09_9BILA|nr:unnamed protein product [Didymodactylos carnosus]CAF1152963.1 unnamed protein product [Didymodactylos carnosus]CAF3805420.1 unnamed protein product [Didymodactylos carnosus]CAF3916457.1 unnamed protein product [Didymodactylos carnosus]